MFVEPSYGVHPMQTGTQSLPSVSSTSRFIASKVAPSIGNPVVKRHNRLPIAAISPVNSSREALHEDCEDVSRSAKREIRSNLREDWSWSPTSPSSILDKKQNLRIEASTQWRERDADSSPSPSFSPSPTSSPISNPYRFDNPDSIAATISARKRKRRRLLLSEIQWNDGLRTFIRRRDAWTGGVTLPLPSPSDSNATEYQPSQFRGFEPLSIPDSSQQSTTQSSTPSPPPPAPFDILELAPLPAPLLPRTNPIRAAISPQTYPSIYRRVILEGVTPTVPINLADVTRALVGGWKDDDEWPPKPGVLDPLVGKRRAKNGKGGHGPMEEGEKLGALAKRGVGRMKKVLGLKGEDGNGHGTSSSLSKDG